jgi:hypothetical protein
MREAAPQLAEALAAAGVPLLGVLVKHENEYPGPAAPMAAEEAEAP